VGERCYPSSAISAAACGALRPILWLLDVVQGKNGCSVYQHIQQKILLPKLERKKNLSVMYTEGDRSVFSIAA